MTNLLQVDTIIFFCLQTLARALAIANVILKTDLVLALRNLCRGKIEIAGTKRNVLFNKLQQFPHPCDTGEWPEIF